MKYGKSYQALEAAKESIKEKCCAVFDDQTASRVSGIYEVLVNEALKELGLPSYFYVRGTDDPHGLQVCLCFKNTDVTIEANTGLFGTTPKVLLVHSTAGLQGVHRNTGTHIYLENYSLAELQYKAERTWRIHALDIWHTRNYHQEPISVAELLAGVYENDIYPSDTLIDALARVNPRDNIEAMQVLDFVCGHWYNYGNDSDPLCRVSVNFSSSYTLCRRYDFRTGGWSGNEALMGAIEHTFVMKCYFHSYEVGGHYVFLVEDTEV